ncbi:BrnT family toxin [Consotaella aegiceratis]|uniref:BrnT family toxin n=1 Tax=Consotaella aegiceratis TaxID=3097961 RepID=UPI002F3EB79D
MFEYDPEKSAANKLKHGIDFDEAQALWDDPRMIEAPARTDDEPRFLVVGQIADQHWSAVCAQRGDNLRLISVRRSRAKEIEIYEGK